jgi:ribonucleoside-triphosphate reductase
LPPWKNKGGEYQFESRFNQGVCSLNLVQIALLAQGDKEKYYKILDQRLEIAYEYLMIRHKTLLGTKASTAPILWMHGALARLGKDDVIDPLLKDGYSSISLGYIGMYEVAMLMTGGSNTQPEGEAFTLELLKYLKATTDKWATETGIGFGLYGAPGEGLCHSLAKKDREIFGVIENITDKEYYTNSFHVDPREEIDVFDKFKFEGQYHSISTSGCISYCEIPNMKHNPEALVELIQYVYDNLTYGEFNTRNDHCHICGYDQEIMVVDEDQWECPQCGNRDQNQMSVLRRVCGYAGENFFNRGKTIEMGLRKLHI